MWCFNSKHKTKSSLETRTTFVRPVHIYEDVLYHCHPHHAAVQHRHAADRASTFLTGTEDSSTSDLFTSTKKLSYEGIVLYIQKKTRPQLDGWSDRGHIAGCAFWRPGWRINHEDRDLGWKMDLANHVVSWRVIAECYEDPSELEKSPSYRLGNNILQVKKGARKTLKLYGLMEVPRPSSDKTENPGTTKSITGRSTNSILRLRYFLVQATPLHLHKCSCQRPTKYALF